MKHPPYHLRSNKSVDRYLFVEALKHIIEPGKRPSESYTYVGFGGPFLEDLKVAEHYFPAIKLISLEQDKETLKRQKFHRFCRRLKLLHQTDEEFVNSFTEGERLALWFDYLGCTPQNIGSFSEAVKKAGDWSMLRITLYAGFPTNEVKDKFISDFEQLLPGNYEDYFTDQDSFATLLQKIIQSSTIPPAGSSYGFHLINSTCYRDGARMITITGLKCPNDEWKSTKRRLSKWPFFTPSWDHNPERINLPDLSLQERLHLASLLPVRSPTPGKILKRRLGYSIGSEESLNNYAAFCRYFPVFSRLAM